MDVAQHNRRSGPLLSQLRWFIRLRWLAGGAVIVGAAVDWQWMHWYPPEEQIAGLGAVILAYNVLLYLLMRRASSEARRRGRSPSARWLVTVAWLELLLDLACLTVLVLWTHGAYSPFLGFYVFHMVFSSLLLPRRMAYGSAAAAIVMGGGGVALTGPWTEDPRSVLLVAGWSVTLLLTVYLTNQITHNLRRQRRRLAQQRNRILAMSERLREQQQAMIQHEKMVALGQMAAGVAHEIVNPLACIDSVLELMRRHPDQAPAERVATLRDQAQRIRQTVRQMTTFAHPVSEEDQMLDVNQIVERAISMVRFDHRIRAVEIERDLSEDARAVRVEAQALEQVLVNLLLNALDAMEGVTPARLRVRTACEGDSCLVEVADTGRGIARENLDHIFEPFFTTKPVGKGTGLGLAISYSLVRRLGGRIDVRSEVGRGTSFTVAWPISAMVSHSREGRTL